jgi:uncharacterized membrane protein
MDHQLLLALCCSRHSITNQEGTEVTALVAIVFNDQYRASEVLNELRRREWDWVVDLDHAVVVRHNEQDKFKILFIFDPTIEEGGTWARLWGSLLSLVLFNTLSEEIIDTAKNFAVAFTPQTNLENENRKVLPNVQWWRETLCLSDEFVRDVGALVQPGDSALLTLLQTEKPGVVFRRLRNYGGTLVHTTLSPEQDQLLKDVLSLK